MQDLTITFIASVLIWILYLGLVVLWFVDGKIKKEQVVHAIVAGVVSWFVAYIIKSIFPTPRPFMVNGDLASVIIPPMDGAFPSGHSATAFALAVTIFLHDRKIGTLFLICAILIGIGRVYANVHYPVDILGGALIGTLVAIIIENVHFKKFVS